MEILKEEYEHQTSLCDEDMSVWRLLRKDKVPPKPLRIIEDALVKFDLSRNEIRVYIFLARSGMRKAREISDALSLHRTETYRILRDLEKRGLIYSVFEKPLKFMATPFEETIDVLIRAKKLKIEFLEKEKKNLIDIWFSLPNLKVEPESNEVFQILEGEEQAILKANEIVEITRETIYVFAPDSELLLLYHSGFTDKLERFSKKNGKVRILTNCSPKSHFIAEKIELIDVRFLISDVEDLPGFIISDQARLLFSIKSSNDVSDLERKKGKISSLWTNYNSFVRAFETLFLDLWNTKTLSYTGKKRKVASAL